MNSPPSRVPPASTGLARSFFFWMDTLGTVSMIFEISSLLGPGGKMQTSGGGVDATLIRVARVAKVRNGTGDLGNYIRK